MVWLLTHAGYTVYQAKCIAPLIWALMISCAGTSLAPIAFAYDDHKTKKEAERRKRLRKEMNRHASIRVARAHESN